MIEKSLLRLHDGLRRCVASGAESILLATDGSYHEGTAAWAIVLPLLDQKFSAGVSGEDQSAFRAETAALECALQELTGDLSGSPGDWC